MSFDILFLLQLGQITPQLALKVLLQFDKAINNALSSRVRNRVSFKVGNFQVSVHLNYKNFKQTSVITLIYSECNVSLHSSRHKSEL